jgi:glutathione S-transferase
MMGYGTYATTVDTLEKAVSNGYLAGGRFSAADVYVGSQLNWGMRFGSIDKRPAFERYLAPLLSRPAYLRASEIDDRLAAQMQGAPAAG